MTDHTKALADIVRRLVAKHDSAWPVESLDGLVDAGRLVLAVYDADHGHQWGPPKGPIDSEHCHRCMAIRRTDGKNSPVCRGAPSVGPREIPSAEDVWQWRVQCVTLIAKLSWAKCFDKPRLELAALIDKAEEWFRRARGGAS